MGRRTRLTNRALPLAEKFLDSFAKDKAAHYIDFQEKTVFADGGPFIIRAGIRECTREGDYGREVYTGGLAVWANFRRNKGHGTSRDWDDDGRTSKRHVKSGASAIDTRNALARCIEDAFCRAELWVKQQEFFDWWQAEHIPITIVEEWCRGAEGTKGINFEGRRTYFYAMTDEDIEYWKAKAKRYKETTDVRSAG